MGVAPHRPAVVSQWLNRLKVLVGTVKAGRMAWRNSLSTDTDMSGLYQTQVSYGTESSLLADDRPESVSASDPTASAARCKAPSSARDIPHRS